LSRRASGLRAWALQRVTAVYLALFGLLLLWRLVLRPPADFAAWHGWVTQPWVSIGLLLFTLSLLLHAWVGTRDVLMDYVHPWLLRLALLTLFGLLFVGSGLWALQAMFLAHAAG
jgi:succinate dehydrogenase / fumarate reductase membrane anchor subunit